MSTLGTAAKKYAFSWYNHCGRMTLKGKAVMQLRMLEHPDLEPLSRIYTYYAQNTVYTYYAFEATPRYMESLFTGRGHACAVATEEGAVIGYVHIAPSGTRSEHCTLAVYLDPGFTGQRRGQTLVRHGESIASQLGYRAVEVGVCTENERSRRLFERMGYRFLRICEAETEKFGRLLDTAYYKKELNGDAV